MKRQPSASSSSTPAFTVSSVPEEEEDSDQQTPSSGAEQPSSSLDAIHGATMEASAFSMWRDAMELQLQQDTTAIRERVMTFQTEFDEASHFIRGDFAWRKQIALFHERLNDMIQQQLDALTSKLHASGDALARSIQETFQAKDLSNKYELASQAQTYEGKLRRTRTSLKKEIDRFTHLERCLRREETLQAKAMYEKQVEELKAQHAAREAELQAILREFKSSYASIELMNQQLMESVRTSREEIAKLKKMLPRSSIMIPNGGSMPLLAPSSNSRHGSAMASFSSNASGNGNQSPPRWNTGNTTDAYVNSLKQSLSASSETIETLKKQVDELSKDKETLQRRVRSADDAHRKISDEWTKAKQLLVESHESLISYQQQMEALTREKNEWHEAFTELQQRTSSLEYDRDDARRYAEATSDRIVDLQQSLAKHFGQLQQWRQHLEHASVDSVKDVIAAMQKEMEEYDLAEQQTTEDNNADMTTASMEKRLRHEFEKKYTGQLKLRLSHERKCVVARLELLASKHPRFQRDEQENKKPGSAGSGTSTSTSTSRSRRAGNGRMAGSIDLQLVLQMVNDAFDHVGFVEWSTTDLEQMQLQVAALRDQLVKERVTVQCQKQTIENQTLALAQAELVNKEKEYLLMELTERHRKLRLAHDALLPSDTCDNEQPNRLVEEKPLTVYGYMHPMELKTKPPPRVRPFSAAALPSPSAKARVPQPSRLRPATAAHASSPLKPKPFLQEEETSRSGTDHIRSKLKSDLALIVTPTENQLDDGATVGADGVLQILQRRKHRKP